MGILIMKLLVHLILLPFKLLFLLPFIAILAALGLVGLCLALLPVGISLLGLLGVAFWFAMLVHAILNDRLTGGSRLAWVLAVWFLPVVGAAFYFLVGRTGNRGPLLASA